MKKIDWLSYQQDMESAFWLDCNEEDVKENAEARALYKYLLKQRRCIEKIKKLETKTLYPRTESWIEDFLGLVIG